MTDFPVHVTVSRPESRSLRTAAARIFAGLAEIARLAGRSFSGMPSSMIEPQMMLYCDPYGLRDKKRAQEEERY